MTLAGLSRSLILHLVSAVVPGDRAEHVSLVLLAPGHDLAQVLVALLLGLLDSHLLLRLLVNLSGHERLRSLLRFFVDRIANVSALAHQGLQFAFS